MQFYRTLRFKKQYKKLPQQIKEATIKQLGLLLSNPQHPSLNLKKMQDNRDIWEIRITKAYRATLQIQENTYILRDVGSHDMLKNP